MSIQMSHVLFLAGSTPTAKAFAKSCVAGDTQSWPINFKIELPGNVRIIVTANDRNVGDGLPMPRRWVSPRKCPPVDSFLRREIPIAREGRRRSTGLHFRTSP